MPSNAKGRGVLPINAAQTRKPFKQQQQRPPAPRLRLIIRRLPPGLTEAEFWESIGLEWQVGKGKVDWAAFKAGKISRDLAKPSRPARAYLKVKDPALLDQLSAHVKVVAFQDSKNTTRDSCLVGPPLLEFAPYTKTPNHRVRHDGRQGTIDQDPEFIDFLQSLTEPITKSASNGEQTDAKLEKVTTTPLVQYLKEKKANKAKEKEAAAAKGTKKGQESKETKDKEAKDSKESKASTSSKSDQATIVKKGAGKETEKVRVAKATQQAMDSIKKSVAEIKGHGPSKQEQKAQEKKDAASASAPTPAPTKRERQRGDASAAARIIGRDLGLVPKEGRRGQRAVTTPAPVAVAAATEADPSPAEPVKPPSEQITPVASAAESPAAQPPTGPRSLRNNAPQPSPRTAAHPQVPKAKTPPQPSPGAKSAFLKHANPSQGVTEELLRSIFSVYGTITRCEIDKKKGLGYVDFTESDALKKAMAASPVKVGNGSVVVLENRTPYRKVSQANAKNASPSPKTSTPASPQVAQASLSSIPEQSQSQQPVQMQSPAPITILPTPALANAEPSQPDAVENSAASPIVMESSGLVDSEVSNSVSELQEPKSPTTTQSNPPSAPRGGRGPHRGHYRGRGYRGRGGHLRGGNRAASSPNPNSQSTSGTTTAEGKS